MLPLRNPVEFAKQAASIDVASGGRLELGVGAGWLREEFEALGAPYERRGRRLVEWIRICRACWTGRPAGPTSEDYALPDDVLCQPTPAHDIPLLIGGHSAAAVQRTWALGDGWLAHQSATALDPDALRAAIAGMRVAATAAGRDPDRSRVALRVVDSAGRSDAVAERLPELADAGVDEVIVDVDWEAGDQRDAFERLSAVAAA